MGALSMLNVLQDPNPLFMKSVRARMRGAMMISWGVVTLTVTAFVSLLIYFLQTKQLGVPSADAAKAVILAILIIQAVLLMFFGTGAVAYGISQERDELLVDYQRMTPMSPTQKILGYLFGLPAREYALVLLTMPFLLVAVYMSDFNLLTLLHYYVVFFMSVWVYHMTGLTAGMVSPMPRMSAMVSMGMVVVLYFALPYLSLLGITFFEHLTIRPTLFGLVWNELPSDMRPAAEQGGLDSFRQIPWFSSSMHPTVYTLLVQGFVFATMFSVVRRKWQRENSHMFSKGGGLVVFGGAVLFILASLWAMVVQDDVYLRVFRPVLTRNGAANPSLREPEMILILLIISTGLIGAMYLLMATWITAGRHTAIEGWRRAKKRGRQTLHWNSDEASSLPVCLVMMVMTLTAGAVVMALATKQQAFFVEGPTLSGSLLAVVAVVGAGLFVQGACERMSGRVFGIAMFLLWMVPFFAMAIITAAFEEFEIGMLVGMPCPPIMLFSAISVMLDTTTAVAGQDVGFVPPNSQFENYVLITKIGVWGYFGAGVLAQVSRLRHRGRIYRDGTSESLVVGQGAGIGSEA